MKFKAHGIKGSVAMSLQVSAELQEQARNGEVDDDAFLDCVKDSLPFAWGVITGLIASLRAGEGEFAENLEPPPDAAARGQLLRLMASDAMRGAIERRYGIRLAFQNCHRVAVFRLDATAAFGHFVSSRSQLLNQRPELVDCLAAHPHRRPGRPAAGHGLGDPPAYADHAHQQEPAAGAVIIGRPPDRGSRGTDAFVSHPNVHQVAHEPQVAADGGAAAMHYRIGDELADDQQRVIGGRFPGRLSQPVGCLVPGIGDRLQAGC
jgi:NucS shadow ORF